MNYYIQFNPGGLSWATRVVADIYPNESPIEIKAEIEKIGDDRNSFEIFCYTTILNCNGGRYSSGQILMGYCKNATMSLKIVEYIKSKHKIRLAADLKSRKLQRENDAEITKKETERAYREDSLKETGQEEGLAKEQFDRDIAHADYQGRSEGWE
ncbi:MAG: hypothetical protein ABIY90_04125 [Puia sp.]